MIRWSFLILDLDRIYDLERKDENGIEPEVFLIQNDDLLLAKQCVNDLSDVFFDDNRLDDRTFSEIFTDMLCQKKIAYRYIGSINLTFGERMQTDYIMPEISLCIA